MLVVAACNGAAEDSGPSVSEPSNPPTPTAAEPTTSLSTSTTPTSAVSTTTQPVETTAAPEPEIPTTLVWVLDEEPPDLHYWDPANGAVAASWLREPLLEDLFGVTVNNGFYPELLARDAALTENDGGSVTAQYVLRDGLSWSDGVPLTADDVRFTFDAIMTRALDVPEGEAGYVLSHSDRAGYETIVDFSVLSATEFAITWSTFYPGYRNLFTNILPAHALPRGASEAESALRNWTNDAGDALPSSGPLLFESWEQGVELRYTSNPRYHGSASPDVTNTGLVTVDRVVVRFTPDASAQVNAMKQGSAQLMTAQPIRAFGDEITADARFTVASSPGPTYEHWGLNLLNVHLADPMVREALLFAIDKSEVVRQLYEPIFGGLLSPEGLGNTYWMTNQGPYENHQAPYDGARPAEATTKLIEAGYVLNADGVMEHLERGPLVLRVGTTSGNTLRESQQQLLAARVGEVGIRLVFDNLPGAEYFANRPFSPEALAASATKGRAGDPNVWDITQFAWIGGPWPGRQSRSYRYDSGVMPYGFVSDEFNLRAEECDGTVDEAKRDACYNVLDRWVTTLEIDAAQGLFVIPLTQKPTFYAYNNEQLVSAAKAPDGVRGGPLANVVDFELAP